MYELRPHQVEAVKAIRNAFVRGKRTPILMASTGFGKSAVAVDIIKKALQKDKKVMFVCDRVQLIEQTSKVFDLNHLDHNIIQADHWRYRPEQPLHLASIQSLAKRKVPQVDLIIVDECHCLHKSLTDLMKRWTGIKWIGLSATPWAKGMANYYDELIEIENTASLIKQGYLCDYDMYGSEIDLLGVKTVAGDYEKKELGNRVTKVVGDVVATWLNKGQNRQTLCFAVSVAHSKAIVDEFIANGVTAAHFDAHTQADDRKKILDDFESGAIKILVNVGITTKGFDSPNTDCLILARPTKSEMLYIQMCGRVLRVSENKTKAIILDHGNNAQRMGFPCDDFSKPLCDGSTKDKVTKKKEELEKELAAPHACNQCGMLITEYICPACGFEPKKIPKVEMIKAELKKLERKEKTPAEQRNKDWSKENKQLFYSGLLRHANQKGYKEGWCSNKYREFFYVWPNAMEKKVGEITPEVRKFIQAGNIKFANKRK